MGYPLATVAASITPAGISAPAYQDILNSWIASLESIYGSDIYLPVDSQDYQLIAILALAQNDTNQTTIATYQNFAPSYAQGTGLSSLVGINGLQREAATYSTAQITVGGQVGTVIAAGVVQDANGNLWSLPTSVTIPNSGSIIVTATCQTSGAVAAAPGTISQIYNPQLGWQTATNASAATVGVNGETDAALRQRQASSTAIAAVSPLEAILANVGNVPGVTRYAIEENQTSVTDANGVPSHSISVIVEGGDISAVAQAIEQTKSPGTGTYGSTSVVVEDPAGLPITINFFELANISIYVAVTINPLSGYVSSTGAALIAAIVNFINSLAIGEKAYYFWILAAAQNSLGPSLNETFVITAFYIGTSPSPSGVADIPIAFNQAAACATADVSLTVL
jgi:uncharacterized phage protein gp47/JayE